eukprot:TRINITY_DN49666_c0_g1_i1.p1 TRINITY_DN49666_c0_g1~~TRINITY_DN49666_c0_g1_i1.p1  ORF type:complete len:1301 (-),score=243.22 TRINITY_DN49666_c0_g1_i1:67-3564(-)
MESELALGAARAEAELAHTQAFRCSGLEDAESRSKALREKISDAECAQLMLRDLGAKTEAAVGSQEAAMAKFTAQLRDAYTRAESNSERLGDEIGSARRSVSAKLDRAMERLADVEAEVSERLGAARTAEQEVEVVSDGMEVKVANSSAPGGDDDIEVVHGEVFRHCQAAQKAANLLHRRLEVATASSASLRDARMLAQLEIARTRETLSIAATIGIHGGAQAGPAWEGFEPRLARLAESLTQADVARAALGEVEARAEAVGASEVAVIDKTSEHLQEACVAAEAEAEKHKQDLCGLHRFAVDRIREATSKLPGTEAVMVNNVEVAVASIADAHNLVNGLEELLSADEGSAGCRELDATPQIRMTTAVSNLRSSLEDAARASAALRETEMQAAVDSAVARYAFGSVAIGTDSDMDGANSESNDAAIPASSGLEHLAEQLQAARRARLDFIGLEASASATLSVAQDAQLRSSRSKSEVAVQTLREELAAAQSDAYAEAELAEEHLLSCQADMNGKLKTASVAHVELESLSSELENFVGEFQKASDPQKTEDEGCGSRTIDAEVRLKSLCKSLEAAVAADSLDTAKAAENEVERLSGELQCFLSTAQAQARMSEPARLERVESRLEALCECLEVATTANAALASTGVYTEALQAQTRGAVHAAINAASVNGHFEECRSWGSGPMAASMAARLARSKNEANTALIAQEAFEEARAAAFTASRQARGWLAARSAAQLRDLRSRAETAEHEASHLVAHLRDAEALRDSAQERNHAENARVQDLQERLDKASRNVSVKAQDASARNLARALRQVQLRERTLIEYTILCWLRVTDVGLRDHACRQLKRACRRHREEIYACALRGVQAAELTFLGQCLWSWAHVVQLRLCSELAVTLATTTESSIDNPLRVELRARQQRQAALEAQLATAEQLRDYAMAVLKQRAFASGERDATEYVNALKGMCFVAWWAAATGVGRSAMDEESGGIVGLANTRLVPWIQRRRHRVVSMWPFSQSHGLWNCSSPTTPSASVHGSTIASPASDARRTVTLSGAFKERSSRSARTPIVPESPRPSSRGPRAIAGRASPMATTPRTVSAAGGDPTSPAATSGPRASSAAAVELPVLGRFGPQGRLSGVTPAASPTSPTQTPVPSGSRSAQPDPRRCTSEMGRRRCF